VYKIKKKNSINHLKLIIHDKGVIEERIFSFPTEDGKDLAIRIGRNSSNHIVLNSETIDDFHAGLLIRKDEVLIKELNKQTFFNKKNNVLYLGDVNIELKQIEKLEVEYQPLPEEAFNMLKNPISFWGNMSYYMIFSLAFVMYWWIKIWYMSEESNSDTLINYVRLTISPYLLIGTVFLGYVWISLNKLKKDKNFEVYKKRIYANIVMSLAIYNILVVFLYLGANLYSFIQENFYFISVFLFILFVGRLSYVLKILIEKNSKFKWGFLINFCTGVFIFSLIYADVLKSEYFMIDRVEVIEQVNQDEIIKTFEEDVKKLFK